MRLVPRRRVHTLAGPYALDALAAAERGRFERHLRGCRSCLREVRAFTATATALGLAVATTPSGLRGRVLEAVATLEAARTGDPAIASVLSGA